MSKRRVYYYVLTDENGVECIDRVGEEASSFTEPEVAYLADTYRDVNYFMIEA